ncbi:hypothetical protein BD410DRAFT_804297 [Rickenella mellea]|uniref:Response regulatory domain-containing protein n=1 Tax=Rickenella mellea TaxID=50990 RepID=A0A4Y7Q2J1_9AGAM|nr:hypothetical protein BD410DRAFT_804297 [Rickenella mellea]
MALSGHSCIESNQRHSQLQSQSLHYLLSSLSRSSNNVEHLAGTASLPSTSYLSPLATRNNTSFAPSASRPMFSFPEIHPSTAKSEDVDQECLHPPARTTQDLLKDVEDSLGPTSDFAKKLFKMLGDSRFSHVLSWNLSGDAFIVKDVTEFTKSILPKFFKHSNFASFVRQLNKYDFHKVKNTQDSDGGEHTWTFKHPHFRADSIDGLENIRRKLPGQQPKPHRSASKRSVDKVAPTRRQSPSDSDSSEDPLVQIEHLRRTQGEMIDHIRNLEEKYSRALAELVTCNKNIAKQEGSMRSLIQYLLDAEQSEEKRSQITSACTSQPNVLAPTPESQRTIEPDRDGFVTTGTSGDLSRSSYGELPPNTPQTPQSSESRNALPLSDFLASFDLEPNLYGVSNDTTAETSSPWSSDVQADTLWQYIPRTVGNDEIAFWNADQLSSDADIPSSPIDGPASSFSTSQKSDHISVSDMSSKASKIKDIISRPGTAQIIRVRGSANVPSWAITPRVLLVDDDAVIRKLSSKLLQTSGCTIDFATDGEVAVNKMNLEKYDLVLMDIVMPKLDGVSATSLIRQFDLLTPIISMTSNSNPSAIMSYYSHGMNDILPKPFTKEGLQGILEKHLAHLKVIQELSKVPRSLIMSVGGTVVAGDSVDAGQSSETKFSSLASMGLAQADETFTELLQNARNVETILGFQGKSSGLEKRGLEDQLDDRPSKRGRFEAIE